MNKRENSKSGRKILLILLAIILTIEVVIFITKRKFVSITTRYGLVEYSKMGVVKYTDIYEKELKKWPFLWLDKDFRDYLAQLRKTSAVVQKNKHEKVKIRLITPTPTKKH